MTQSELVTDSLVRSTNDGPADIIEADEIAVGSCIGRYRLERRLGRGGTGEVWKARDPHLGRDVAIKLVRSEFYLTPELRDSFLREGQRLATLAHPSILEIYDVGIDDGRPFLVTEFAPGGTLAEAVEAGPLAPERIVAALLPVARAAHFAHLRGVVHRDVKPSNILFRANGEAVLGDFGLAVSEEEQLHERPSAMGTLVFMPPEQMRGASHAADGRADVYSLGVTLYLGLTGRFPFLARTPSEYRRVALEREPRPLRAVDDAIDPELERICLRCLAREPADRYTTALDLANELDAWVVKKRVPAKRALRASILVAALGVGLLAVGGGFVVRFLNDVGPADSNIDALAAPSFGETPQSGSLFAEPLQLLSPSEAAFSAFRISEAGDSVVLSSDRTALLKLGTGLEERDRVAVELVRPEQNGAAGVFWGRRIEEQAGEPTICFFSCGIMSVGGMSQLYVAEHSVPVDNLAAFVAQRLIRVEGIEGDVSRTTRVDVRDFGTRPSIVVTNGQTTLSISPDASDELLPQDVRGELGLYCYRSNVEFRDRVRD